MFNVRTHRRCLLDAITSHYCCENSWHTIKTTYYSNLNDIASYCSIKHFLITFLITLNSYNKYYILHCIMCLYYKQLFCYIIINSTMKIFIGLATINYLDMMQSYVKNYKLRLFIFGILLLKLSVATNDTQKNSGNLFKCKLCS